MVLTSVNNYLADTKSDTSNVETFLNSNNEEFPFAAFESIFKRIEYGCV